MKREKIEVDIIIPVHNAAEYLQETVESALAQLTTAATGPSSQENNNIDIYVCCFDDASTDNSLEILRNIQATRANSLSSSSHHLPQLLIQSSSAQSGRGAGFARNQAVAMRKSTTSSPGSSFLCFLDSDDIMHPTRVKEQVECMMQLPPFERPLHLLGTLFDRHPPSSTDHYTQWANSLSDERLVLEKFREMTLIQPTWFMCRSRFDQLGGYLTPPVLDTNDKGSIDSQTLQAYLKSQEHCESSKLVHSTYENFATLKVAEDLRLFHAHLQCGGKLRLVRSSSGRPLTTYRYRHNSSQSAQTPRRLLLHIRVRAFEGQVLRQNPKWKQFIVWGGGRDGKDFIKALRPQFLERVYCIADVDEQKIERGSYCNAALGRVIPIVHFSELASKEVEEHFAPIQKAQDSEREIEEPMRQLKRQKVSLHRSLTREKLQSLPVVVCVSMYRTNGALENNVSMIDRVEGDTLWHFN